MPHTLDPRDLDRLVLRTLSAATDQGTRDLRQAEMILAASLATVQREISALAHFAARRARDN